MHLLILGGTRFLGRHLVDAALQREHAVTLFNRGRSNPQAFPNVEQLTGDRDGDLDALRGRRWDAVIDTCGYIPRIVRQSAELLADAVKHYTFISTVSVYADPLAPGSDENASLGTLAEPTEQITNESYGPLKVLCEQVVEEVLLGHVLTIRPGLVVGPYDYSDRFTYWPRRVAAGGTVLAPARPEREINVIDARDLAAWTIRMVEARHIGIFNAGGANDGLTMGRLLATCKTVSGSDAGFVWLDEQFLLDQDVGPWIELPLWLPESDNSILVVRNDRAKAAELTFRPLANTIHDTLAWDRTRPPDEPRQAGLRPEREQELLRAWYQQRQT